MRGRARRLPAWRRLILINSSHQTEAGVLGPLYDRCDYSLIINQERERKKKVNQLIISGRTGLWRLTRFFLRSSSGEFSRGRVRQGRGQGRAGQDRGDGHSP